MKRSLVIIPSCVSNVALAVALSFSVSLSANAISGGQYITEDDFARTVSHIKLDKIKEQSQYNNLARANVNISNSCGSFSPMIAVGSSFAQGNLSTMFDTVITNAKGAVMGLASRLIQEANPGLFKYLQHGVDAGYTDYLAALQSCEGVQDLLVDNAPDSVMGKLAMGDKLLDAASPNTSVDISAFMKSKELRNGNSGVKGIDGKKYGGKTTPSLKVVNQTIKAGWCMLTESGTGLCSGVVNGGAGKPMPELKKVFPTALDAESFARNLIGEVELRSCEGCDSVKTTPPQTVSQLIDAEAIVANNQLSAILRNSSPERVSTAELERVSTSTYPITRNMFINLNRETPIMQKAMLDRISLELATARTLNKIVLVRQIMLTGLSNSKLVNNEALTSGAKQRLTLLDNAVKNYYEELKIRANTTTSGQKLTSERINERKYSNGDGLTL
ncbi:hypothetical protein [Photobacterium leiognathi]|uniref:hypothetical protein n=1 Tax=Photobacterium leiognathi TaxID=553611 RepID=UPI002981BF5C|nr:hypothetical protein [Photobacterium leiognathi]